MPIAAFLGLALIGLIGTSWFLNRDALRQAVEAQIRAVTGLDLVVNGSIDVSVFPGSYVSFHDVRLKGGGTVDPALQVDVLTANLRLLPLLLRRFEIADVMMLRPHIRVVRDGNGESNWTPFVETIARTMKPGAENQVSFSEIRIQDGVLNYEDATNHVSELLADIDLSLAWPSISRSFAATGQFDWRGERVDGSVSASDFVAVLSGDRSGLKARLASAPLKLAFDGTLANRTSMMMEGTVTIDSLSLRNALRWMGQAPPGGGGFGRFALKARANVVGASVALTNVNVELDGNVAEGVMTFANNGRQTLQATLAAGALDFTPYISTFRLLASGARDWNRQLFDLNSLSTTDLDMRLSAAKVTVGSTKLGRTAFGANLRGGALALSIAEAQMYGGIAKGTFSVARSDAVADVKAQLQFTDVDLQACVIRIVRHQQAHRPRQSQPLAGGLGRQPVRTRHLARRHRHADRPRRRDRRLQCRAAAEAAGAPAAVRRRQFPLGIDALRHAQRGGEIQRRHRDRRRRPRRRPRRAPDADRHRLGAGARIRSEGCRQPDLGAERGTRLRPAVRGAGPVGRSTGVPRSRKPDPPFAGRCTAAGCGEGSQDPRRGSIGDRAVYRRRPAAGGAGCGRGGHEGELTLSRC